MNFTRLKQFIREILLTAPCPYCRGKMGIGKVEILNVDDSNFAFRTQCEHCDAEPIIHGKVHAEKALAGKSLVQRNKTLLFTPETVKGITKKLEAFKGKDVRELFRK